METKQTIDTTVSEEFRMMLLVIAEKITEFHGQIPFEIMNAYKEYAVSGDIEELEKVRVFLYEKTGILELHHQLVANS